VGTLCVSVLCLASSFRRFEVGLITSRAKAHAEVCEGLVTLGLWRTPQPLLTPHVVVTPTAGAKAMELLVAKMIYANNLAYKVVNDQHFVKLIHELRPGFKLPSYKKVSGPLLDEVCGSSCIRFLLYHFSRSVIQSRRN
jgi:hypothetical protein